MTLEIVTEDLLLLFGNYYCYNLEIITIQLIVIIIFVREGLIYLRQLQTYGDEGDFEFLSLLPPPLKCWVCGSAITMRRLCRAGDFTRGFLHTRIALYQRRHSHSPEAILKHHKRDSVS